MLGWINQYRYSKAFNGEAKMSNSYTKVFYKHNNVTLDDIYYWQEVASGGYYNVRTLSSASTGYKFERAKFSINLSQAAINQPDGINNAYIFIGVNSGKASCEFGLQRHQNNWHYLYNGTGAGFNDLGVLNLGTQNIEIECEIIKYDGGLKMVIRRAGNSFNIDDADYRNSNFYDSNNCEFYRTISLCPVESNEANVVSNLNNEGYFKNVSFKNCQIAKKGQGYEPWLYNSSFNQFAVAFNDEFIEVNPSTETANISYKGRDNYDRLILN